MSMFHPRCVTRPWALHGLSRGRGTCMHGVVFLQALFRPSGLPPSAITGSSHARDPTISDTPSTKLWLSRSHCPDVFFGCSSPQPMCIRSTTSLFWASSRSASSLAVRRAVPRLPLPSLRGYLALSCCRSRAQPQRSCFHC